MVKYKTAKIFNSRTDFDIFKDNYCYNSCKFHKQRENGFYEYPANGGCPIEDRIELSWFDDEEFPYDLKEVWEDGKCLNWCHCPFYTMEEEEKV